MLAIASKLQHYLHRYRDQWPLSGSVLVARRGEIVLQESFGFASLEHRAANTADTKFGIWSITKSFAAMAIMLLAEEGRLALDDPASRYVPELAGIGPVTVRHLMHHRSGLPNFTSMAEYNRSMNKWPQVEETVFRTLLSAPPQFEPGASFAYNNTGYYILGVIVERVSGVSFASFLRSRILEPLGMTESGMLDGKTVVPGLASAYHSSEGQPIAAEFVEMSSVFAAGGMYSNVHDLYKWDQSFYTERLLPAATMKALLEAPGEPYGMGWFLDERKERRRVYHGGAYRGFRSELHRYPDDGMTVIVLSNYDFTPVTRLAETLADIAFGEAADIPAFPPAYPLAHADFEPLMGTYEGYGCKAVVSRNADGMYFVWNDREVHPIYPIAENRFHHRHFLYEYGFKPDDSGAWTFLGMNKVGP